MIKLIVSIFIVFNVFLISLGLITHSPPGLLFESIGLAFILNFFACYYVLEIEVKRIFGIEAENFYNKEVKE